MSSILGCEHECAYCGWNGETRDHIPALSQYWVGDRTKSRRYSTNRRNSIPCCRECNCLLSNIHLLTIQERAEHLLEVYALRYKKELNAPVWSDDEIAGLGEAMQMFVRAKETKRMLILERMRHLGEVARFGPITVEEYWDALA